jgi:hypothetical protein
MEPLEFHEYKNCTVAIAGERVVCLIAKVEGAPLECYGLQLFNESYVSIDAAKKRALAMYNEIAQRQPSVSFGETLASALEGMAASMRKAAAGAS